MPDDRRAVLVALVAGLALLVLVGRSLLPSSSTGADLGRSTPAAVATPVPAAVDPSQVPALVDVAGAVRRPGVYRLRPGARVRDAIRAAGGARRGAVLAAVNLAERVSDGEQVLVPDASGAAAVAGSGAPAGSAQPAIVHLNSATPDELDALDGIGPALAARIVAYRTQHGGFRSVAELADVSGIGPARLAALRGRVAP
jgi:competence protein ComEA